MSSNLHKASKLAIAILPIILILTMWVLADINDRKLRRTGQAVREGCIEINIYPEWKGDEPFADTKYRIGYEEGFFCPDRKYTPYEVLVRADAVLRVKGMDLQMVFGETSGGETELKGLLGKQNDQHQEWRIYAQGERVLGPLNKMLIKGTATFNLYYH